MTVFALRFTPDTKEGILDDRRITYDTTPREHFAVCRDCLTVTYATSEAEAERIDAEHQCPPQPEATGRRSSEWRPWTTEEDNLALRGICPPGRTERAYTTRRHRLETSSTSKPWTEDEDNLARHGICPPGRTKRALAVRRCRLGCTNQPKEN